MRHLHLHLHLTACALGLFGSPCFAAVNAPVTSVILYPGSATVMRTAQVAPGAQEIAVALPTGFNPQTLRVQGTGGVVIGGITTRSADDIGSAARDQLNARIEALRDQQALLEADARSAGLVKEYLERFVRSDGAQNKQGGDPRALAGLLDTVGRGATDAMLKIQKLTVQIRDTGKKIELLQREMARLPVETRASRLVSVRVSGGKGGAVTLSYQLGNAGWKPSYRAGLDSVASTVALERLATISQSTGEDWSNVRLVLSTAQPRHSPVAREPQPWLLSWRALQAATQVVSITGSSLQRDVSDAPPAPLAPVPAALGDSFMTEIQGTFATEFAVPGRVSLASDGSEVQVGLSAQTLAVRQHLRVAPRLEAAAIVMAEAPRPEGVWPAGSMQLFRDGNYIGSTHWNPQQGERVQFAFGRDELLKVSMAAVEGKAGTRGLFGSRSSRDMADLFTLVNHHKTPVDVLVLESSPVTTSDEVKVHARFDPMPAVQAWEQRRGVVAWKKTLGASEAASFNVEYRIDFPKEGVLTGMR